MAYEKRELVNEETLIDKDLLDHMQDGIGAAHDEVDKLNAEVAEEKAGIFGYENPNDILDWYKHIDLSFAQYGDYRLRAVVTGKAPSDCPLTWNKADYSVSVLFKDSEGKTVFDASWWRPSPMDVAALYTGEYVGFEILLAKGYPSEDGNIAISLDTDLPLADICFGDDRNDLKQVIKDVETLSEKVAGKKSRKTSGLTLIAHGGFAYIYPENTLLSLYGAKKYGYKICGCDLRITSDGHFVLMHDETVDRTTNGTGNVSGMTLEQIKALIIDLWVTGTTGESWTGLTVPTLEEFLEDCIRYNIAPMLEVRDFTESQLDDFMAIIRKYNLEDVAIVESFYTASCDYLRSISDIQLAPLIDLTTENVDYCKALGNAYININATSANPSAEMMAYAIEKGVEIIAWTVNTPDRARELEQLGVKYVITDRLVYANARDDAYVAQYVPIADNLDGTIDNWGFVFYTNGVENVNYKDLVRFRGEIFYTQDKPTFQVGAVPYVLLDKPNEWQMVDFVAPTGPGAVAQLSMKDKTGLAYVKNASVAILKV